MGCWIHDFARLLHYHLAPMSSISFFLFVIIHTSIICFLFIFLLLSLGLDLFIVNEYIKKDNHFDHSESDVLSCLLHVLLYCQSSVNAHGSHPSLSRQQIFFPLDAPADSLKCGTTKLCSATPNLTRKLSTFCIILAQLSARAARDGCVAEQAMFSTWSLPLVIINDGYTYYTQTAVIGWYAVNMMIQRSFSGLF